MANEKRLLITGCMSSGTTFMSELLKAIDIRCSHEGIFNQGGREAVAIWQKLPPYCRAESSWFAAPFVGTMPANISVLHQVRHPLVFVRSLMGRNFMGKIFEKTMKVGLFIKLHCPESLELHTSLERSLAFWLYWNQMIEKTPKSQYALWRVRHIRPIEVVEMLRWSLGIERTEEQCREAMLKVGTEVHHRERAEFIRWSDIPKGALKDEAEQAARRYGYFELENPVAPAWGA